MTEPTTRAVKSEDPIEYGSTTTKARAQIEGAIISQALEILGSRLRAPGEALTSPADTRAFLTLKLAEREHEVFACLFLDNRHRVIAFEELFRGTIDQASVYPREVVKTALRHNAAALILAHNHPSGIAELSHDDRVLTKRLTEALSLVDVRVLDHIIIGGADTFSFSEAGII